jgi:glycosyltransferase involved in cell wall biosynthesis
MVDHPQVGELLERARILVLPSRQEGQPNVVMEAMARGVPVIATRVGGVPDLISHKQTGWLTEPGDAAAIAEGIREISSDGELRTRLADNAIREIRRYDWPIVEAELERTLEEMVTDRRKKSSQNTRET